jgi:hypothetical protein
MSPDGSALELGADEEEEEDVDRGLDELLRSDVVGLASLLALVLEPVAVVLSSLPSSSQSATPAAASTTTPIQAMRPYRRRRESDESACAREGRRVGGRLIFVFVFAITGPSVPMD